MVESTMEEMTLPTLFDQAVNIHSLASTSATNQATIRKGIEALRRCDEMVSKLGLFSTNESKEDISTANLKYLLVSFYLGEMSEKIAGDERSEVIKVSQDHLKEFISFCEALELVPDEEIESTRQTDADSSTVRRAKKIARFRRQKAAELKLQEIKERKERRHRSLKAAAISSPVDAGDEDILDDDCEEEREAWLTTISLSICKAFDLLDMLKKEEEMLSAVKNMKLQEGGNEITREILDERNKKAETWHRNAAVQARFSNPVQPITCANFAQDVIEGRAKVSDAHDHKHQPPIFGPASLVGGRLATERERMAAKVFQPGYRLPTMSIEEAGLREMEIMNRWQENNVKLMEDANSSWYNDGPKLRTSNNEEEEKEEEAAEEKARAWDDWKDDNPRGAGNKKLTPCG